jgi:FdhD protein
MTEGVSSVRVRRVGGRATDADDQVAIEAPLELRIDGRSLLVLMRTPGPGEDEELARGFLFTEGAIAGAADVAALERPERLTGDEVGNVLDVRLRPGVTPPALERAFYVSSSCGACGKASIASLRLRAPAIDAVPLTVTPAVIGSLPERLRAAQPRFAATGGLHAAGLFRRDGTLLCAREDVGRHNALDKLVGWALGAGRLPLSELILAVSGRVSYEILQKAVAAGLPLIVAVGAPSSLAIELAEQLGVTLVGFVRPGGFNVYVRADRIVG